MKKLIPTLSFLVLTLSGIAWGQTAERYDNYAFTLVSNTRQILALPNVTVTVCGYPATGFPCTNVITTYTSSNVSGTCPSNAQLTRPTGNSCVSTTDAQGNFGFWAQPGTYTYTLSDNFNHNYGTYVFTLGGGNSNPLIISAGGSGNPNFDSFRLQMQNSGELDCDFLKNDGSMSSPIHPCFDYTYFTPGNSAFSPGVFGFGSMVWMFGATGGLPVQGTYDSFQMPDPPTTNNTVCKVTHQGVGSSGVTYYIRYLDANSGYTFYSSCSDPSGYPTPDSTHVNTVTWWQPQSGTGYGGSASNLMLARGTPDTIINLSGSGVLSQLSACIFPGSFSSPPTDPSCSYTDNGLTATTSLSALSGIFYDGAGGNSTSKIITGRLFTLNGGGYIGGGAIFPGRIVTQMLSDPPAPTVVPNITGADSCSYAIVVHDATITGVTNPSSFTTIGNCNNGNVNVSISWNVSAFCTSIDLLKGDSSHSLATGLPCTGPNLQGGFGGNSNFTYVDLGSSTTPGYSAVNNTADIVSSGNIFAIVPGKGIINGNFVVGVDNVTGNQFVLAAPTNGTFGFTRLDAGDGTHAGQWVLFGPHSGSAVNLYSCGGDASTDLTCRGANNGTMSLLDIESIGLVSVGGGSRFNLSIDGSSNFLYNGHALMSSSGLVPTTALGGGSPGPTTALFGDQTYKQVITTTGTPPTGQVVCYLSATVLGHCTSTVGAGGACTCVSN